MNSFVIQFIGSMRKYLKISYFRAISRFPGRFRAPDAFSRRQITSEKDNHSPYLIETLFFVMSYRFARDHNVS